MTACNVHECKDAGRKLTDEKAGKDMAVGNEMEDRLFRTYSTLVIHLVINFSIICMVAPKRAVFVVLSACISAPQLGIFF